MRERQEVERRFWELHDDRLKKRKEMFLSREPQNCAHNEKLRVKRQGHVGFCQNPVVLENISTNLFVCNDCDAVQRCHHFKCRSTDESIEKDFEEILKSPSRVGSEYPKLAMLIWFLQEWETPRRTERLGVVLRTIGTSLYRLVFFRWW